MDLNIILDLINRKQEGSYWDFKREWYEKGGKGNKKMLHDIICMANNLDSKDAFIIIGVDEENDYNIKDVKSDEGRRDTQKIVDFLKDKKFAGGIRPTVYVNSYLVQGKTIDIIIIKNDNKTPYYLTDNFQEIKSNHIYTRIQDTNTPLDRSADLDKVEYLWKKRFGLTQSVLEKFEIYMEDYKNWVNSPNNEMKKYYKFYPEFTIEYKRSRDISKSEFQYYSFSQEDISTKWYDIKLKYHQTTVKEKNGISLDGGRYFTLSPNVDKIELRKTENYNDNCYYHYFTIESFEYKLNEFFFMQGKHNDYSEEHSRIQFFEVILLFESESERTKFKEYVKDNWDKKEDFFTVNKMPNIPKTSEYDKDLFEEKYKNALILKNMLNEFRLEKQQINLIDLTQENNKN